MKQRTRTVPAILAPALAMACLGAALAAVVVAPSCSDAAAPADAPAVLAGLRAGLTIPEARAVMEAWGVPCREGDPRDFDRAEGGTVEGRVLLLDAAPSTPVGPLLRGSLLFLDGRLFWVQLSVDAGLWRSRTASLLGRPAVKMADSRNWVWPSRQSAAWATARDGGHDVTLAFYGTALQTGMMSDPEYRRAIDDFLSALRERGLPTNDDF